MAFILSQIIKKKLPEWNERILTDEDLDRLSATMKVPIIEDSTAKAKGEYLIIDEEPIILVRPHLKHAEKLWVTFHEFGHHLLHYPVPHKFSKGLQRRMDREANFFASIALMPTKLIGEKTFGEIMEDYGYLIELIQIRKDIYEAYRI